MHHPGCDTLNCVAPLQIQENIALSPFTTLGVGGPARFFARIRSEHDLGEALAFAKNNHLPIFPLGGGSNLLVHDGGFPGLILHLDLQGELQREHSGPRVEYHVPAGVSWDDFVLSACQNDDSGVECLAGIPGLTGGTPVQNVGAYGQEVSQTILRVRAFDLRTSTFVQLTAADCGFHYRSSIFNSEARGRYLVTSVSFALLPGRHPELAYADLRQYFGPNTRPSPLETYHAVRDIRRNKGMLIVPDDPDTRSAGSFFKNPIMSNAQFAVLAASLRLEKNAIPHWPVPQSSSPQPSHNAISAQQDASVKLAAAWLVEQAGFTKGYVQGRAGISSRHTLALVNRGGATATEMLALRDHIRSEVTRRFGIYLEQEPVEVGSQPTVTGHGTVV